MIMRNSFAFFRTCRPISRISGRYFSALNPRSSIHVLGTGNLGKFVAHSIAKHCPEAPVTLLFHRPGLVTAWEAGGRGIECLSDGVVDRRTNFNVELLPPASPDPTLTQSVTTSRSIKYLIVATKTYTTTAALSLVKNRLDSTSSVLFLQNGMGTTDEVSSVLFRDQKSRPVFMAGICSFGVYSTSPFSIVHAGRGSMILGSATENAATENAEVLTIKENYMVQRLLDAKDHLGTNVVSSDELREAQLLKLVVNAVINPLTAIFNCKNGQLVDQEPRVSLMKLLIKEIGPVVRALLPALRQDASRFSDGKLLELVLTVAEATGKNTSSMLQDIQAERKTEIDYINGYIVSRGKQLDLLCPNNMVLTEMVKGKRVIDNNAIHHHFA